MTYPLTLRLTEDGTPITIQRHTARAVATAALGAVGSMTLADGDELRVRLWPFSIPARELAVVALADWIARSLGMDDAMRENARDFAGRKGIAR
jgi:hypothetical protein